MSANTERHHTLEDVLRALGLTADMLEPAAETSGYRIEFEQQFAIELHGNKQEPCRLSTRLCVLGKSLQVQESQLKKAMQIYSDIQEDIPAACSLAISDHDNCLRVVRDLVYSVPEHTTEVAFNEFVNFAFAFKQTYLQLRNSLT
ncbi:MAG TPA: hypothetical protein VFV39_07185 [Limnobacter sp.]|nr:hypothetical protein [Limnobacter sp.]